eukprot:maker-scaffold_1-snap-gene-31.34-mRNA-1 protein AED:0.02 eAED:0.02 QI:50/0.66/0.75/1/1/1/4/427/414
MEMEVYDYHCGGEPARIVFDINPKVFSEQKISTLNSYEKRVFFMGKRDDVRKILLHEPRGYPCQNANIVYFVEDRRIDYVIMEQGQVYPLMSGHNTICICTALIEQKYEKMKNFINDLGNGILKFSLHAPGGIVEAKVKVEYKMSKLKCHTVTLRNVPSFVCHLEVPLEIPFLGELNISICYGGMFYCIVDVNDLNKVLKDRNILSLLGFKNLGVRISPEKRSAKFLCSLGQLIKDYARKKYPHPDFDYPGPDILAFVDFSHSTRKLVKETYLRKFNFDSGDNLVLAKNTVIMTKQTKVDTLEELSMYGGLTDLLAQYDNSSMIDRSPCGTGTCAIMAYLHAKKLLGMQQTFVNESILGSQFIGRIREETSHFSGGKYCIIPEITGYATLSQKCTVVVSEDDDFPEGFQVGDIW